MANILNTLAAARKRLKPINLRAVERALWTVFFLGTVALMPLQARPVPLDPDQQALAIARDYLFDFTGWEVGALWDKGLVATLGPQAYMTADQQTQFVRDYLDLVSRITKLESEVEAIYVDPEVPDPEAASLAIRLRRDDLRRQQAERQSIAEAIIQQQISEMLVESGFGLAGQVLPPVGLRFTQPPSMLVVSPRDHIERIGSYGLKHGLTVDEQERLEEQVDRSLGVSSLVVPLGGLAVYPAMMVETDYAPNVFEVGAHEWTHHYLSFFPLGFYYGFTPELSTINETVANIVGGEIGRLVLERYYPDLVPPPPPPAEEPSPEPGGPPSFDFRAEMHITRVHVDELLAQGHIEEAERYMEARRRVFVENGYQIRKLNQAYFAFHGQYADQPGASGADPIGPALRELRTRSSSLREFVLRVRGVTSFEQIQAQLQELGSSAP
jgi:hypothetical protein